MASPSVTHTFSNGTTADASAVNTNFSDIINSLTDGTKDLSISALTCAGNVSMNGNVTLGNATGDDITITGSIAANIPIKTDGSFDIGSSALGLDICYFGDGGGNTVGIDCPAIASNFIFTLPAFTATMPASDGAAKDYLQTDGSGVFSFVGGPVSAAKTTTYTATTADKILTVSTSSARTLTLYAVSGNSGRTLWVIKTSNDFNALTIDGNASETINGATTTTINTQYEALLFYCTGTEWLILERRIPATPIAYTPGTNGFGTISSDDCYYIRLGSIIRGYGEFTMGTTTAAEARIDIPSGLTIGNHPSDDNLCGKVDRDSTNDSTFYALSNSGDTYITVGRHDRGGAINKLVPINGNIVSSSGSLRLSFYYEVPISGWKG